MGNDEYSADEMERILMELISGGGEGRSLALESIQLAKRKEFGKAEEALRKSEEAVSEAHKVFFDIMSKEASGEKNIKVTVLLAHALDHIMNAIVIHDIAVEFVDLYRQKTEE